MVNGVMNMNREIEWRGVFNETGYGIWGRNLVKTLLYGGYKVKPHSLINRLGYDDELYEHQNQRLKDPIYVENIIPLSQPYNKKTGFCTCTELRKPPQDQIVNLEKAKFILALSKFSADAYKRVVSNPDKVFPVNFPIDHNKYNPNGLKFKFNNIGENKFKFLTVGRIDVRKNIETLIKAFKEEFGRNRNVVLILKIYSPNICIPLWLRKLKITNNIYWFNEQLPDMSYLYRSVNAYITTDLGEAWSAPTQEAMLSGIPTIAPRHSGHLDYMNDSNSYLIKVSGWKQIGYRKENYERRLLPDDGEVKYPDFDDIKQQMRIVYNNFRNLTRKETLEHKKIQNALQTEKIVSKETILKQLNKCFDWVFEND